MPKVAVICLTLISFLTSGAIAESMPNREKIIVLTFDDGPRPYVLKNLLPLLKKYHVPATFFMVGAQVLQNHKLVKKMHEDGYEIENHSFGHDNFIKLFKNGGSAAVESDLRKTSDAIYAVTGRKPEFFRPPFWEINGDIEKIVRGNGLTPMKLENPDINTLDYDDFSKHRTAESLITRVEKIIKWREKKNFYVHVLTFHELPLTVETLEILIPYFQNQGYKFIRLDSLPTKAVDYEN